MFLFHPDTTIMGDWALKTITSLVFVLGDWALKTITNLDLVMGDSLKKRYQFSFCQG